jgi:hypothetical protein
LQIVWNQDKKKWINKAGTDDEISSDPLPPPKELSTVTKGLLAAGSEGPAARLSSSNVYRSGGPGKGKTYFN